MNARREKTFALITGASAGLGKALAAECARRGRNLLLVSLPGEQLANLGRRLEAEYNVEVHCYETDLTLTDGPQDLIAWIRPRFAVDMLINNAGTGGSMPLEEASIDYIENILQLNIRALCLLTYALIPELKKHRRAYILNIASLAAFSPMPFKTVYPASKAFVYSFSRGLQAELSRTSISVTVIGPGSILTNSDAIHRTKRHGFLGRWSALTPEWTARKAIRSLLAGRPVVIPGVLNKLLYFLMRYLPPQLALSIIVRAFGREVETEKEVVEVREAES